MKPLTKARREELQDIIRAKVPEFARDVMQVFDDLLGAEQFWREAVKHSKGMDHREGWCLFGCDGSFNDDATFLHKPDCLWLLAQEAE